MILLLQYRMSARGRLMHQGSCAQDTRHALGILLGVVNVVRIAAARHEHHRPIRDSGEIIICAYATSQSSTSARVSNRHIPFNDLRRFAFKII